MTQSDLHALRDRLGPFGERLAPVPPEGRRVLQARELLDQAVLASVLRQTAHRYSTDNLPAVASLWNKHYNATLLYPVLAAMTLAGVGLDAEIDRVRVVLAPSGLPERLLFTDPAGEWVLPAQPDAGQLLSLVWSRAVHGHLALIIGQLRACTGVSGSILWGNVGNLVGDLYDRLAGAAPRVAADRAALLDARIDPVTGGPNRLRRTITYREVMMPDGPETIRCRTTCCQRYLLPDVKPCYTCSRLTDARRAELLHAARTN